VAQPLTAEAIAAAVRAGMPPPPAPVQQPPTAEEIAQFEKQFNVVRVTPDTYKAILGVAPQSEAQVKALENLLHSAARQGISMSTYTMQQKMDERFKALESRYAPMQDYVTQQQVKALETSFLSAHPDLKDHQALVKEVAVATRANNIPFKSQQEAFQFVADRARSLLGKAAPTGQQRSASQQQSSSTRKFAMTPTSLGGNPGTGRSPQQSGATIRPQDVFANEPQ